MSASWPTSVATDSTLYVAVNELQTNLSAGINSAVTTVGLNSTTNFPTVGLVLIDNEVIKYTGISGNNLTGCTRGFDGSTAASHSSAAVVSFAICADHHNVLKNEIEAIETYLSNNLGTGSQPLSTGSRALASSAGGKITESSVTSTELGYLSGVTSAIQTQLNAALTSPLSANLAAGSHKITGLAAGTTSGDSVRYEQVIGVYLPLAGGTLTDNITFSPSTKGIVGTTTNDSAAAGNVGEVISASVTSAANTGSTGQWADVTSISLTAGQWNVFGVVTGSKNTATWTRINCGLGTTSGNNGPTGGLINFSKDPNSWASSSTTPVNSTSSAVDVFKLSGPTTVYLKVSSDFSGGQPQATGYVIAIRSR